MFFNTVKLQSLIASLFILTFLNVATAQARNNTIADIVSDTHGFDTLQFALETAGLIDALDGHQRFTVFAPTDEAFQNLADVLTGGDVLALATALVEADLLDDVLTYHAVNYKRSLRSLLQQGDAHALSGQTLKFGINNNGAYVQGINNQTPSNIIVEGISASNGRIFPIDQILINIDPAEL